jgi:hypothetical protein
MVRSRHVKKLIENAMENCGGSKMQGVKSHLLRALKEISEMEKKEEKKKTNAEQKWKFDISKGRLVNLTRDQGENILGAIDRMIEDEGVKNLKPEEEGPMIID